MSKDDKYMITTEAQVAEVAVAWFEEMGWDVYQEVQLDQGGPRADIIAVRGRVVTACEVKLSKTLKLAGQALNWRKFANYVWVVTMDKPNTYDRASKVAFERIMSYEGIGCARVQQGMFRVDLDARLLRIADTGVILDRLHPKMKTVLSAGSRSGGQWTEYRESCSKIAQWVEKHPGCTLKQLVDELGVMHYSNLQSARSCLKTNLITGKVHGVRYEICGKHINLFPK